MKDLCVAPQKAGRRENVYLEVDVVASHGNSNNLGLSGESHLLCQLCDIGLLEGGSHEECGHLREMLFQLLQLLETFPERSPAKNQMCLINHNRGEWALVVQLHQLWDVVDPLGRPKPLRVHEDDVEIPREHTLAGTVRRSRGGNLQLGMHVLDLILNQGHSGSDDQNGLLGHQGQKLVNQ